MPLSSRDRWCAGLAGVAAFLVYVRTLAPGLILIVDTPMFQFIGRVLGIAHNPGYPLYVMLSHPFSYIPVGSLAYRANLFSALLDAIAVAMTCLVARRLGAGRLASVAAALPLAFGRVFWSQAVIAEVYALNAALVAAMLASLLAWGETRRPAYFFGAASLFSLGLGNHTTIVGFAPGMVAYALMKDWRFSLRPSTILGCTALLAAGLLQYGFLLIRTRPGVYAESPARTVGELFGIMSGRQFAGWLFAYDLTTVLTVRLPLLVRAVIVPELTVAGSILSVVGVVWLVRSKFAEAVLLILGAGAMFGFCLNYAASDIHVFLIPVFLVLWSAVAAGGEWISRTARRSRFGVAIAAAMLLLPAWQLRANFGENDLSHRFEAKTYFDRLFETIPPRTLLVREDFIVDRAVSYKLVGEKAAYRQDVGLVGQNVQRLTNSLEAGYRILSFPTGASRLRFDGLDVDYAPYLVTGPPAGAFVDELPPGSIVALAVPAAQSGAFIASAASVLSRLGMEARSTAALGQTNVAVLGVVGVRRGALAEHGQREVTIDLSDRVAIGRTGVTAPGALHVRASDTEAAIAVGARDIVRSSKGAVMAIWTPAGSFDKVVVLPASAGFRPALTPNALTLREIRGASSLTDIGTDRTDVSETARTGWLVLRIPPAGRAVLEMDSGRPLSPHLIDRDSILVDATVAHEKDDRWFVTVASRDSHSWHAIELACGGLPTKVTARMADPSPAGPAAVAALRNDGVLRRMDDDSEVLRMNRDEQAHLLGAGWSEVDHDDAGTFRWMVQADAHAILPVLIAAPTRIRLQALREQAGAETPTRVSLSLNGRPLDSQLLENGWHTYEWTVPPDTWRARANEMVVRLDRLPGGDGPPRRGFAVADVTVVR